MARRETPGGIELGELGDGRHLAQQPQPVEAPLLERAGPTTAIASFQPIWLSISLMNWPILAAAASACSC